MNIGLVGLGLIGGSWAKALQSRTAHTVWGTDADKSTLEKALASGAISGELAPEQLPVCDLVILALYPAATVEYVRRYAALFQSNCLVIDSCGVKEIVCTPLFEIAQQNGFQFVGTHPMAGAVQSGFDSARDTLFDNASIVVTPPPDFPADRLHELEHLFNTLGFLHIKLSDPAEHDAVIACTSQLAHVVSNAYVKSPAASRHRGFSAGSFKDMTRVATLNPDMWTELFFDNRDNLISEIDALAERLANYSDALKQNDPDKMRVLLQEGTDIRSRL